MADRCKHDPNFNNTTLIKSSKYKMISPQTFDFFCLCCKKTFKFGKDDFGKYYEVINDFNLNK
jgi:hypothetical protein